MLVLRAVENVCLLGTRRLLRGNQSDTFCKTCPLAAPVETAVETVQ
jgi:hypothetical protein